MKKNIVGLVVCALLFALSIPAQAQQPAGNIPRIGFLTFASASDSATVVRHNAFRQGLRDLGYVEGKNINIEYRFADGKFERLPELAEDLVRLKVDILVVANDTTARAAKKSTTTIPIVMTASGDPIGSGVVASLARPGGNVTGLYQYSPELLGKRLELLKEVLPKVSRFAFLNEAPGEQGASGAAFKDAQGAAKVLDVRLQLVTVTGQNPDFESAFRVMLKDRIGAFITSPVALMSFNRERILQLTEQSRIPAIHPSQEWVDAEGLMSYGTNLADLYRRAATYVDKILKGRKPADLPVEQPMKFELIINLKAAKQIGLTIPPQVLARADRVIR